MSPRWWMLVRLFAVVIAIKLIRKPRCIRQRLAISSLSGKAYMRELLEGPSQNMFDLCRMTKHAFTHLCGHFREKGWLSNSKHLDVEEKMAMFLMTISHKSTNRFMKNRFQHSGQTISKYFHEVLYAMLKFSKEMIVVPDFNVPVEGPRSQQHLREGPFRGAVGALDGTLIDVVVPVEKQIPFRGRGGKKCMQNVLGICDFDMKFIYVVAGWEGIAHDSRVLNEALTHPRGNFPLPPSGKYYLCDAAYTHTRGFMCPYRNTRYWLKDFERGGPTNKEETFNHVHARLRNVIERSFGVLKARFPILKAMPPYSFPTQVNVVMACIALHNFLRRVSRSDDLFMDWENDEHTIKSQNTLLDPVHFNQIFAQEERDAMVILRGQIANELMSSR